MQKIQAGVVALLVALALMLSPDSTYAQGEGEDPPPDAEDAGDGEPGVDEPIGDDDDDDDDDDGGIGSLEELCKLDPDNCVRVDMDEMAGRDVEAEMYAVQQIWALRANRFEVNPYLGLTMNDQFVAHPGPGLALNYYIFNWLAAGLSGNLYAGLNTESDFNFETSRSARVGLPITEYSFSAHVNATFVPAYGKFSAFQNFIFHYDFYAVISPGGVISTRPIAVVDPDNRTFDFNVRYTWGAGLGIRIFFTRYLSAMLEIRDYMFFDDLENPAIVTGLDSNGTPKAQDDSTWLADETNFTNNVQAQVGLSVFLPFTWEYRLPK